MGPFLPALPVVREQIGRRADFAAGPTLQPRHLFARAIFSSGFEERADQFDPVARFARSRFQRLFQMPDRVLVFSKLQAGHSVGAVNQFRHGLRIPPNGAQRFPGFAGASELGQDHSPICPVLVVPRMQSRGLPEVRFRFPEACRIEQGVAQADVGGGRIRRQSHGARKQRQGVSPPGQLRGRARPTGRQRQSAGRRQRQPQPAPPFLQRARPPRQDQADADAGQIGVAVGKGRLFVEPDSAHHRQQRHQKPKPADQHVGLLPPEPPGQKRQGGQSRRRQPDDQNRGRRIRGVQDGQSRRPERFFQIGDDVGRRQRQPGPPGGRRPFAAGGAMRDQREIDENRRQEKQRDFFRRQMPPPAPAVLPGRSGAAAQGPEIQQQQQERQHDQDGFRHQTQQHQAGHRPRAAGSARPHLPHVRQQGQQKKQTAENVLAFRDPRHGFHAQRMPGEQGRRECAAPARARHPEQHPEQQRRIRRVQQHVRQMMSVRPRSERRDVRHVRKPQQRQPPLFIHRRESLPHARPVQAPRHHRISGNVERVVQMDEVEVRRRPEQRRRGEKQQDRQREGLAGPPG